MGITPLYYTNIIIILYFTFLIIDGSILRWSSRFIWFPWQSDDSTIFLSTYRSLWLILVAVCTLIPETAIVWCRVSDKIHSFKHFVHYVVSLQDYIHHINNIQNNISTRGENENTQSFSTKIREESNIDHHPLFKCFCVLVDWQIWDHVCFGMEQFS